MGELDRTSGEEDELWDQYLREGGSDDQEMDETESEGEEANKAAKSESSIQTFVHIC